MNLQEEKYSKYALCREMLETSELISGYNPEASREVAEQIEKSGSILLSGEGSSRIFPAKKAIYDGLRKNYRRNLITEGATQAMEYELSDITVFGASNSGQTKEVIRLFHKLKKEGHQALYGLTAGENTPLSDLTRKTKVLSCGGEKAVAATKSVAEQALYYQSLFTLLEGGTLSGLSEAGADIEKVLTMVIDKELIQVIASAETIYFAGRNNGVAEELTLKTNEITRKKSGYLEGTYSVHGIEEVLTEKDVMIIVDPFEEEEEKYKECLVDGVGMKVIAISSRKTLFPTIIIPDGGEFKNYLELASGWNLLVETGLALGIDLDNPVRARKVGNEFTPE